MVHALKARESGERKVILFNLSGRGLFDMSAYESLLDGKMNVRV
jgi:tryptophan synthase beta chain